MRLIIMSFFILGCQGAVVQNTAESQEKLTPSADPLPVLVLEVKVHEELDPRKSKKLRDYIKLQKENFRACRGHQEGSSFEIKVSWGSMGDDGQFLETKVESMKPSPNKPFEACILRQLGHLRAPSGTGRASGELVYALRGGFWVE